ncbi:MAG: hypothetical protein ACTSRA_03905 [Promethearchaeota archaeon]
MQKKGFDQGITYTFPVRIKILFITSSRQLDVLNPDHFTALNLKPAYLTLY